MNKFSLALILFILPFMQVHNAQAGVIIGALSGNAGQGALSGLGIGFASGMVVGGSIGIATEDSRDLGTDAELDNFGRGAFIGIAVGSALGTLLDVDASLSVDVITRNFKARYPFINNPEAINDLSAAVKNKFHDQALSNPKKSFALVSLTRTELLSILSGASITAKQFEAVAEDLK